MSIADLKLRLADVPGIETLTLQLMGGRSCYGFAGKIAAVDPLASDEEIEDAIRNAARLPSVAMIPDKPKEAPMTKPAAGSFAASLRALMDEARSGVAQARADGLAKVSDAVAKLGQAKEAVTHVTGSMAKTIEDEAAAVLAELGQISNMGPE